MNQIDRIRAELKSPDRFNGFSGMNFTKECAKREIKYLVPAELMADIRRDLKPYVYWDKYSDIRPDKQYTVRSIYYDTCTLRCYDEKSEGLRIKKKYRIRGYNSEMRNETVFLEIKRKYEDFVSKYRALVKWNQVKPLFQEGRFGGRNTFIEKNDKNKQNIYRFMYNYYRKNLMPTVLVIYEREAFFSKFDRTLRITIDKNIRSLLYPSLEFLYTDAAKYAMPRYFIFEVKFYRGLPLWMRSLITRYELLKLSLSKYTICIDSHKVVGKFCHRVARITEFTGYHNIRGGMEYA